MQYLMTNDITEVPSIGLYYFVTVKSNISVTLTMFTDTLSQFIIWNVIDNIYTVHAV